MTNIDVAVKSFWQLARHWNQGGKAKRSCLVKMEIFICTCRLCWDTQTSPTSLTLLLTIILPLPLPSLLRRRGSLPHSCAGRSGESKKLLAELKKLKVLGV